MPTDPAQVRALDGLLAVTVALRRHVEVVARDHALSGPQARLLFALDRPVRMREAAEATGCEPAHLSALADQLETAGLLRREVDRQDRPARQLALTASGARLRERLVPALLQRAPVVSRLDVKACESLSDLLRPG